jgi:hypothetical protein
LRSVDLPAGCLLDVGACTPRSISGLGAAIVGWRGEMVGFLKRNGLSGLGARVYGLGAWVVVLSVGLFGGLECRLVWWFLMLVCVTLPTLALISLRPPSLQEHKLYAAVNNADLAQV